MKSQGSAFSSSSSCKCFLQKEWIYVRWFLRPVAPSSSWLIASQGKSTESSSFSSLNTLKSRTWWSLAPEQVMCSKLNQSHRPRKWSMLIGQAWVTFHPWHCGGFNPTCVLHWGVMAGDIGGSPEEVMELLKTVVSTLPQVCCEHFILVKVQKVASQVVQW